MHRFWISLWMLSVIGSFWGLLMAFEYRMLIATVCAGLLLVVSLWAFTLLLIGGTTWPL